MPDVDTDVSVRLERSEISYLLVMATGSVKDEVNARRIGEFIRDLWWDVTPAARSMLVYNINKWPHMAGVLEEVEELRQFIAKCQVCRPQDEV
jgi:hypothetical protein